MLEKLDKIENKYEELGKLLSDPEILGDSQALQSYAKAHAELTEIVSSYREYKKAGRELEEARQLLKEENDADLLAMAREECTHLEARRQKLEQRLKMLLLPRDQHDEKNVLVEIRAGTGGEEAALFAGDLYRMYARYAENRNWRVELLSCHATDKGGFKEIVFLVEGKGAYRYFKFESGVHRVQRIPTTESGGRIHTSAATVAILPEAEEVEVEISPEELRVDVFCSSGPGGQSVNTTQSAVRITHLPSGIVVSCQDEKSQHKNKEKAMKVLRARLLDQAQAEKQNEQAQSRKLQVGSGDRSERIRTYNFPQGRVTDHRIGLTLHRLQAVLEGDLDEIIQALIAYDQAERLQDIATD